MLTELREMIHGVRPQVLADNGLTGALADIAVRSAVPVDTALDADPFRLPGSGRPELGDPGPGEQSDAPSLKIVLAEGGVLLPPRSGGPRVRSRPAPGYWF
ncbi:hypothetical protein [Streptomyces sp. 147326]|uniref:hypothetical protein n=1 Tax=Streptomyces sp. 147326 TaxID=3074379 RepID=UPI00385764D3